MSLAVKIDSCDGLRMIEFTNNSKYEIEFYHPKQLSLSKAETKSLKCKTSKILKPGKSLYASLIQPLVIRFVEEPTFFFVMEMLTLKEDDLCDIISMHQERDSSIESVIVPKKRKRPLNLDLEYNDHGPSKR